MPAVFAVETTGTEAFRQFDDTAKHFKRNASRAMNRVSTEARTKIARRIVRQVALPPSLLNPSKKYLYLTKRAKPANLETRIRARGRPTSLARYARGKAGAKQIAVEVKPGHARFLRRAFLIRLRAGDQLTETQHNLGLAIRLREGERIHGKIQQVQIGKGLYLLYGPSIQQLALANAGTGEFVNVTPQLLDDLENEVLRLNNLD